MNKNYKSLNEAFYFELKNIIDNGLNVHSRGSDQKEVLFRSFSISDPMDLNIMYPSRKFNQTYALVEWLWYLAADPKVHNIGKYASIWNMIEDDNGEVESNYGTYLFPEQWEWVINELLDDTDSRRATIPINQPYHKNKNNKDIPCTQYLQFFIRNNKLHLGVSMRSNDIVFGMCNDIFTFCLFQQLMFNELKGKNKKLRLGKYHHHAGSLHIYDRHYSMADKILEELKYVDAERKNFHLLEELTYSYIKDKSLYLPSQELSKKEIKRFIDKNKEQLYYSNTVCITEFNRVNE